MAGGKQTPRQRMMGILYLVLLGLIALDIPENLLDAFKNISDSLSASKNNVEVGIDQTMKTFEATKLKDQKERAEPIYNKAKQAKQKADDLTAYVEDLKKKLLDASGGMNDEGTDYKGASDIDVSVRVMINENKLAKELHQKIDDTREGMLSLLSDKERQGVNLTLSADAPPHKTGFPNKSWEDAYFGEGVPMTAAMTQLTKIEADTKNAESEVVKKILGEMDQAVVTLDQFRAVVVPNSNYILQGQQFSASIYLSAYDSKSNPSITVDGSNVSTKDGIGTYTVTASGEGVHTFSGQLSVKSVDGPAKTYPISGQYLVAKPSAVVSPDKMNVLYIGLPNPLSISAPGVPASSVKVSMSGGSISGSGMHYTASVREPGTAKITVMGDKGMVLGSSEFRVKRIPDPKFSFAGKSGGTTSAANIRAQDYVFAKLDNFEFDAKFNVTRFTLMVIKPRQDAIIIPGSGNTLSSQMHQVLGTVIPGTTVVFKDITAVGPDGTPRYLDAIVINAN